MDDLREWYGMVNGWGRHVEIEILLMVDRIDVDRGMEIEHHQDICNIKEDDMVGKE